MPDSSNNSNTRVGAMAPDASTSPVDWSRPIEAVHEDGRVVPVTLGRRDETMDSSIFVNGYRQRVHFDDKEDWAADWGGLHLIRAWRIRNVQPTTPELDPVLWDRMVALVRRMAKTDEPRSVLNGGSIEIMGQYRQEVLTVFAQARAIVADLPEPVDPDLIEAEQFAHGYADWCGQEDAAVRMAYDCIKRGRELAGEQA